MTQNVKITIDGVEVEAPRGKLVIRVAEELGIEIPRFCDHPLLAPAGACRQCLVEVEGQRKPLTACTLTAMDGLVVKTQLTSEMARDAQRGIMEFLLINHPLDCPVCDKGGECPLQNQAMSAGRTDSRFTERKRTYDKPLAISSQVLLDRERCVLCQRCTRFSDQIAGDPFISLLERGSDQQVGTADDEPFSSYFSGNTIQICPVGALTGTQYRFRSRPFDLVSSPGICEHCSAGCAQRTDHRRGRVLRRLAGSDAAVNEEWNCDKGRWAFQYATADDRVTTPMIRDAGTGELRQASWPEALSAAAEGLRAARAAGGVGVLTGGRLTVEDAFSYATFARVALGTNDIDFRSRPLSAEEADFLAARVADSSEVTYADLERAPAVVLVALEPEEECPILFLRLRKAHLAGKLQVLAVAPFTTPGLSKVGGTLVPAIPGAEAAVLRDSAEVARALSEPGAVLLVGERLATVPGGFTAVCDLVERTGAALAWVPRRAGDRGAVEAGCLPGLLPGGRLVADEAGRADLARAWGVDVATIPAAPGRDTDQIIRAAAAGDLGGLLVAGVDPDDLADPEAALAALDAVGFLVSCEVRRSAVTDRADVVLPVSAAVERAGAYVNWEGRVRTFDAVLPATGPATVSLAALADHRILDALAAALGVDLGCADLGAIRGRLGTLTRMPLPGLRGAEAEARKAATRAAQPTVRDLPETPAPGQGQALLAAWAQLIDRGRMQDGDEHLAGTARAAIARISAATAAGLGVDDGALVTVGTGRGEITLPVAVTEMPDDVVWIPTNSPGSAVRRTLGVTAGALVTISTGGGK